MSEGKQKEQTEEERKKVDDSEHEKEPNFFCDKFFRFIVIF